MIADTGNGVAYGPFNTKDEAVAWSLKMAETEGWLDLMDPSAASAGSYEWHYLTYEPVVFCQTTGDDALDTASTTTEVTS